MGLGFGSGSSSGDKDSSSSSSMNEVDRTRTIYNRHTSHQTQLLEAFYRENPQPSEEQRRQLSREIGLDVKQIKFWYQNKKALTKAQVDRADNNVLRAENERISYENEALKEALNTIVCSDCGGPSLGQHDGNPPDLQELLTDNAKLKQEYGKLSKMMVKYTGKLPLLPVDSVRTRTTPSPLMNNQQAGGSGFRIPASSTPPVMMNNYNNVHQQAGLSSTMAPPPMMMNNAAHQGVFGISTSSTLSPPMMNNAALNQPPGIFGVPTSSTIAPTPMMMNNAALNQPQGIFGIPSSSTMAPPPMMMNNAALNQPQGNFGIPSSSALAPPMMNNYDTAAFNQQQGIFRIPSRSTLAPAPAPTPDGLPMPDNNLLIESSSSLNGLEQAMEADDNDAGGEGPSSLAELMKLLA